MLEIKKCSCGDFYAILNEYYLYKDGTLCKSLCLPSYKYEWSTKQEVHEFLSKWLPKWSWLTQDYVKEEAAKGEKEALDCSIVHWKQVVCAGYDRFLDAFNKKLVNISYDYCGLCQRSDILGGGCDPCLIAKKVNHRGCVGTPYFKACTAFEKKDKQTFEAATIEELNFLTELRNESYGNPYSEIKEMSKMISIEGKDFSEETIIEALKQHCDFNKAKKEEKYQFQPGDVALSGAGDDALRVIIRFGGSLRSFGTNGRSCSLEQDAFESCNYKYIGKTADFINSKTVEKLKRDGKVL